VRLALLARLWREQTENKQNSHPILTHKKFEVLNALRKQKISGRKEGLTHHSHSHFYSHFGFFKIFKPCFIIVLQALIKIGAGEGNRIHILICANGGSWRTSTEYTRQIFPPLRAFRRLSAIFRHVSCHYCH
jgi:hypothetical protein